MDFVLKFSGEILVVALSLVIGGLNFLSFAGSSAKSFQDQSLAVNFINNHSQLNPKLYAKNSSIVTVVNDGGFVPEAQASDDFSGLSPIDGANSSSDGSSIVMSDENSILAPNPDSIQQSIANVVKKYITQPGDTLNSIAAANGISVNSIKWSNPNLVGNSISPGWVLLIPPVDGVAVIADSNTTLPDLAVEFNPEKYNPSKNARDAAAAELLNNIITYNGLDSAEDIDAGQTVIIPGGVLAQAPAPKPTPKPKSKISGPDNSADNVTSISDGYDADNHTFPRGYCTYYVATKMKITFGGNAKNWLANAGASGYVTSKEPVARAAVVFSGYGYGRYGHVAYVEQVSGAEILVSEMNYDHFNRIDERWVSINSPAIKGYIYP